MKKVHIISIGGAVMHNIAIQLARKGYKVTGSDDILFDPSLSRLKRAGLYPDKMGWDEERISKDLDFVILGMHAKKDNPELQRALELGVSVFSFPEFIGQQAKGQKRIVVSGSHGKTTTSSMIVHLLNRLGVETDYLIGAQIEGVSDVVRFDNNPYFVIEGDEYPSSAVDNQSKFMHYDPHYVIITGIAWDHMNIFPTYENYFNTFVKFMSNLSKGSTVIFNSNDAEVVRLMEGFDSVNKIPYGVLPYTITKGKFNIIGKYPLHVIGKHNISNLTAAITLCEELGFEESDLFSAAQSYSGASKRLEVLLENDNGTSFIDFAHAPSKVKASVNAVKELDKDNPLVAVLELHTYSSLNKDFLPEYKDTLSNADRAVVMYDPKIVSNKNMESLNEAIVKESFNRPDLIVVNSSDGLKMEIQKIFRSLPSNRINSIFMSSGNFGGTDIKSFVENLKVGY